MLALLALLALQVSEPGATGMWQMRVGKGCPGVAGHIHSRALTLLNGGQNLFWSLERVQVGFAVGFLGCMPMVYL